MTPFENLSELPAQNTRFNGRAGMGTWLVNRLLNNIERGRLRVTLPGGGTIEKSGHQEGSEAILMLHNWRAIRRVLVNGDIGFAEGFIENDWSTPDLTALIRFAAQNQDAFARSTRGSLPMRLINRMAHALNANTRRGSRRNIEAHYDLGNEFYRQWLDPSMLYSSAIFDDTTPTLEAAQRKKLERIAEKLQLTGNNSVLEIGCGWGALAIHLATQQNADVTGITLSPPSCAGQKMQQRKKVRLAGSIFGCRITATCRVNSTISSRWRCLRAVGESYWPSYFEMLKRCLKPGGRAVLQIISIDESRFDTYRRKADFIQKYVFPGGFLPSDSALEKSVGQAGLKLTETELFGQSYALTLAEWRQRFHARWQTISLLGFDERFRRLWDYYLCYCEAGFAEGTINVGLYTIEHG